MDKLLKRIADLILALVALLGLLSFLPIDIKGTDVLIISGTLFFLLFIALITHHVSKLEERIKTNEERFIREKELLKIKKDIETIKLVTLRK